MLGVHYVGVLSLCMFPATFRRHAYYNRRLDVVQQPKRARMCGFGDKVHIYRPSISLWVLTLFCRTVALSLHRHA